MSNKGNKRRKDKKHRMVVQQEAPNLQPVERNQTSEHWTTHFNTFCDGVLKLVKAVSIVAIFILAWTYGIDLSVLLPELLPGLLGL